MDVIYGEIRLVNAKDHSDWSLLVGHTDIVVSIDTSIDGKFLVSGGKDHAVRVWNLESRKFGL
jgi:WD40 repeat protein